MSKNMCPICGLKEEGEDCELKVVKIDENGTEKSYCCTHLSSQRNRIIK